MSTKKDKNKTSVKRIKATFSNHKLLTILVAILLIVLSTMGYTKYKDWENAQDIKGLARDFPALVEDIEAATGLDLEVKSNCMQTQEKFGEGVRYCEFVTAKARGVTDEDILKQIKILESQDRFKKNREFDNKEGYIYDYRNKTSCQFAYEKSIYLSCVMNVRDANSNVGRLIENR